MSCRHCRDSNAAMQRDLDIALRDAERANRTGLELLAANNKLQDEVTFLHTVAQGVSHYQGCAKNAANTGALTDECLRCQVGRKDEALRMSVEALAGDHEDCASSDCCVRFALDACRAALEPAK